MKPARRPRVVVAAAAAADRADPATSVIGKPVMRVSLTVLFAAAPFALIAAAPEAPDEMVFEGGRVVDGTGAPAFRADVAIRNGRIRFIGLLTEADKARALRRVNATGLVVAPGFIDLLGWSEYHVLVD